MNLEEVKCDVCDRQVGWVDINNNDYDPIYCSKDCASMDNNT